MTTNRRISGSLFALLATMTAMNSSSWYSKDNLQETGRRWSNQAYAARDSLVNQARNNPKTAVAIGVGIGALTLAVLARKRISTAWKERPMWLRPAHQKKELEKERQRTKITRYTVLTFKLTSTSKMTKMDRAELKQLRNDPDVQEHIAKLQDRYVQLKTFQEHGRLSTTEQTELEELKANPDIKKFTFNE
jgi:hypothetical protein